MTKSDLINQLSRQRNIPVARAESIVDAIFGAVEEALCRGERIEIRGLGSFELRTYGAYSGRNPRTGAKVDVKPKRLPFFKVGKEIKDRINQRAQVARSVADKARGDGARGDGARSDDDRSSALVDAAVEASAGAP